jgi:hypothetical protein
MGQFMTLPASTLIVWPVTPAESSLTRKGSPAQLVAAGVMQHVALNVDTEADLLAMRDRVRAHGYWVMGPLNHDFCKSIYLAPPEGIILEFSTSEGKSIDGNAWIDPEVVKLSGITPSDLHLIAIPRRS